MAEPRARDAREFAIVEVVSNKAVLQLCSWGHEHTEGSKVPTIAGVSLPTRVGTSSPGSVRALCVAPGSWVLVADADDVRAVCTQLRPSAHPEGLILTDMSSAFTLLRVQGQRSRDLLAKGCGIDFHERRFWSGLCAHTRFAQIALLIDCLDASPTFELHVERSYSAYLSDWLHDAAAEIAL